MQTTGVDSPRSIRSLLFEEIFYLDPFEEVEGNHPLHTIHIQEDKYDG